MSNKTRIVAFKIGQEDYETLKSRCCEDYYGDNISQYIRSILERYFNGELVSPLLKRVKETKEERADRKNKETIDKWHAGCERDKEATFTKNQESIIDKAVKKNK